MTTKQKTGPKPRPKEEPAKPKLGRPVKGAGRVRATWYIEEPFHRALEFMAKARGISRSDVLNEILGRAKIA